MNLKKLASGGRILKVARMGHPCLRKVSLDVEPDSDEARQIIADMAATLVDLGPVQGLAAPQVHINRRVLFYQVAPDQGSLDNTPAVAPRFLLNAYFEPIGDEVYEDWEGCVSIPDFAGWVPRPMRIRLRAVRFDGTRFEPIEEEVSGHHARVLQHEIDHLDGVLYPDHMTDLSRLGYREEIINYHIRPS